MIPYFREQFDTIEKSLDSLSEGDFNAMTRACVAALRSGGKIIASGLGKNVPICEKFVGTMNSLSLDARFLHTNTAIHGDLGIVGGNDIVLLLSKSGKTAETAALAEYLIERNTDTWILTFNRNAPLIKRLPHAVVLDLANEGDLWDIVPNNSTTIYLILLQGLALAVARGMDIQLADFKRNHPGGGIGEKLRGQG